MRQAAGSHVMFIVVALAVAASDVRGQDQESQEPRIVEIDTLNVRDTLYHLSGGGGNALALVDELNGGVVLVDTKRPGWGQAVTEAVEAVTDLPVTTIINTHAHAGHAGSNAEFAAVTQILAHENTSKTMARMELYAGSNAASVPNVTFTDRYSLLEDLDRIDLYYFGPAHTDGDIIVVFPAKGVAYLGDLFPSKATPIIDADNGGSGVAFPDTLAKAVAEIDGVTRVITGHAPPPLTYAGRGRRERASDGAWRGWITWEDFEEYADFTRAFLEAVETSFHAGQSVDEAAETLTLPDRYVEYGMEHARENVEAIYNELATR